MAKVLVVDDESSIIWAFRKFLEGLGHDFLSSATAERAVELAREEHPDLVIIDVRLPGMDGFAGLEEIRRVAPGAKFIVITAHGTLDTAVKAVKLGAAEYLPKPVDLERARVLVEAALRGVAVNREVERLRREVRKEAGQRTSLGGVRIVGKTAVMQEVFKKVAAVAASGASVLLSGESGTGKELLARAVHANSPRAGGPFEAINCASIPETLLESELYGHERGAFTGAVRQKPGRFELAHGGSAFLDEVGDIPPSAQVKLLRFLEDRKFERVGGTEEVSVEVRIISATNQNLEECVRRGRFREDLYFRLNVVRIDVPALRDRREDIPLLVAHFLEQAGGGGITDGAMESLGNYFWPGNVRELRNVIERGVVLTRGGAIRSEHLPESILSRRPPDETGLEAQVRNLVDRLVAGGPEGDLYRHVALHWEKALLHRVLEMTKGNQVKAAELLGINRMTLRKKLKREE